MSCAAQPKNQTVSYCPSLVSAVTNAPLVLLLPSAASVKLRRERVEALRALCANAAAEKSCCPSTAEPLNHELHEDAGNRTTENKIFSTESSPSVQQAVLAASDAIRALLKAQSAPESSVESSCDAYGVKPIAFQQPLCAASIARSACLEQCRGYLPGAGYRATAARTFYLHDRRSLIQKRGRTPRSKLYLCWRPPSCDGESAGLNGKFTAPYEEPRNTCNKVASVPEINGIDEDDEDLGEEDEESRCRRPWRNNDCNDDDYAACSQGWRNQNN
eukprot:m51a1_g4124 hypothetical protein (274) ;mRNA; f:166221-167128